MTTRHSRVTRRTSLAFSVAVATSLLAACGSSSSSPAASAGSASASAASSSSAAPSSGGTLKVGADLTYPPYDYTSAGAPSGFDPEFMNDLAAAAGMKATFVDTRFAQLIPSLASDKFEVIASALYITAERAKQVDFIPYFTTGSSIISRSASTPAVTVADLCGKKIGTIKGAAVVDNLNAETTGACKGKSPITVQQYPTDPEATQALLAGQVNYQISDAAVAADVVTKTGSKLAITSTVPLYPVPVGIAVSKGDTALRTKLENALVVIQKSGQLSALLKKYNLAAPDQAQVQKILGG